MTSHIRVPSRPSRKSPSPDRYSTVLIRAALVLCVVTSAGQLPRAALSPQTSFEPWIELAWMVLWGGALLRADRARHLLATHPVPVLGGLAICWAVSIGLTAGAASNSLSQAIWLGWAATVVLPPRACLLAGSALCAAVAVGIVAGGTDLAHRVGGPGPHAMITAILNPLVLTIVGLALAGVFRAVVASAPSELWRLRTGGPASTRAMTALLASTDDAPVLSRGNDRVEDSPLETAPTFSQGEREVLLLLADGHTPKQIALVLGIERGTVYSRIRTAKAKVGATTIAELVLLSWAYAP